MQHTKQSVRTLRRKFHTAICIPSSLRDLMKAAAFHEEISQSDFLRRAIEERATRVLLSRQNETQR